MKTGLVNILSISLNFLCLSLFTVLFVYVPSFLGCFAVSWICVEEAVDRISRIHVLSKRAGCLRITNSSCCLQAKKFLFSFLLQLLSNFTVDFKNINCVVGLVITCFRKWNTSITLNLKLIR